jgi:F0F1-type ATP synthase gamma subunit
MLINKDKLTELLKNKYVKVTFTKLDGSERKMTCTLHEDVVKPYEAKTEKKKQKKEDSNLIAVWDVEKDAFRSFKLDALTDYQVLEEGYEL